MKRLLISLIAALSLPNIANAESFWLVLSAASMKSASLEKIEMASMEQCIEQGEIFKTATYMKRNVQYICLKGKWIIDSRFKMKWIHLIYFVKKYLLIFTFLLFLPQPVHAEKKRGQDWIDMLIAESIYTGSLMSICMAYKKEFITAEQRISLLEPVRKEFYSNFKNIKKMELNSSDQKKFDPKRIELNIMKMNNKYISRKGKKCFPEIE